MNIKYVSLLSLLCVAGAQCTEKIARKKIDTAKAAYFDCRNSYRYALGLTACDAELKAFEQTRQEFLNPHRENIDKNTAKLKEYKQKQADAYPWHREFGNQEIQKTYFKTWGHSKIIDVFDRKNEHDFLNSNKSTEELSKQILDEYYSIDNIDIAEIIYNYDFSTNSMHKAKDEVMQMIKQQP